MSITCNFDKDNHEDRKNDKVIVRVPSVRTIGADTPVLKPVKHGAYLWDLSPRPRSSKSWRDISLQ